MQRLLVAAVAAATLVPVEPAAAIIEGSADGNRHPNVAGLVSQTQYEGGTWVYCSGTLIAPKVVLTAAHCNADGARTRVTFDSAYEAGDPVHTGTFEADPAYGQKQNDPHDIAVVVLDEAVSRIAPAKLPRAGSLSALPGDQQFTAVGYGAHEVTSEPGGHRYRYDDVRMYATGTLNAINPAWLRISMNPATGNGGTCYGDSGGPNFLGDSNLIAATTITGDAICRSTNVTYRLDTRSARDFLRDFVKLP